MTPRVPGPVQGTLPWVFPDRTVAARGYCLLADRSLPVREIVSTAVTAWSHEREIDVEIPFILVIERRSDSVRIRLRGPASQEK
jgi:hypothetical protein